MSFCCPGHRDMSKPIFAFDATFENIQKYYATMPSRDELLAPTIYYKFDSDHAKIFVRYIDYWNYIHCDWWSAATPLPSCNYIILNGYKNIDEVLIIVQTDFTSVDLYLDNNEIGKAHAIKFPLYLEDIEVQYRATITADTVYKTRPIIIMDRRKQYKEFLTLSDYLVSRYKHKKIKKRHNNENEGKRRTFLSNIKKA